MCDLADLSDKAEQKNTKAVRGIQTLMNANIMKSQKNEHVGGREIKHKSSACWYNVVVAGRHLDVDYSVLL